MALPGEVQHGGGQHLPVPVVPLHATYSGLHGVQTHERLNGFGVLPTQLNKRSMQRTMFVLREYFFSKIVR